MRKIVFALTLALPLTWSLAAFAQDAAPAKTEKKAEKKAEKKEEKKEEAKH